LASLLPVETLLAPDVEDGSIDQLIARGIALELVCAARILAHWVGFAVPLLAALPVAGVLLGLSADDGTRIAIALALGTPALASLAVVAAALTAGLKGGGALAGLIVLPLALPVLIFGVGSDVAGAFRLLAAASLVALAVSPFAAAAALRPE
jgi:heme exporter protein B